LAPRLKNADIASPRPIEFKAFFWARLQQLNKINGIHTVIEDVDEIKLIRRTKK